MTSHELAKILLEMPDVMVTVRGYEGGVNEITEVQPPARLDLHVHTEWYYGQHEYPYKDDIASDGQSTTAIHIG